MTPDEILPSESRMELPPPVPTQEAGKIPETPLVKQLGTERNPELIPKPGAVPGPQQPVAQQQAAVGQAAPAAVPGMPATQTSSQQHAHPAIADDIDLIEKEWVEKAKAIVNQTKDDPFKQNKAINKMKADYIKKRYNKDIQVSE